MFCPAVRPGNEYIRILAVLILAATYICVPASAKAELTASDIEALKNRAEIEGWTFKLSENPATARSADQLCGFFPPNEAMVAANFVEMEPLETLPARFDWRDYVELPPARDQDTCGGCWAFSTVGALECAIKLTDGVTEDLSEQWLVNCNRDGWACDGGTYAHDYHQWKADVWNGIGAVYEIDCPYTAGDDPCLGPYPHQYLIQSWSFFTPTVANMKRAILEHGPISVSVYANTDLWSPYSGGVFNACEDLPNNHAVVLVGWDDNQGANGVWFLRNSWGAGWGEDGGYMRIEYGCSRVGTNANFIDYNGPFGPPLLYRTAFAFNDGAGDGNGRGDPGENDVELIVEMANYGTDALGLTVDVTTAYPEIVFSNSSSAYGDLTRWDQVDNTADPIVFDVDPAFPPTIVDFVLTTSANGGAFTRVDTLKVHVGQPQFIIVDDDAENPGLYEEYYTYILDSLRTPYVVWGKDTLSSPPADTLGDYPFVIWFTGDHRLPMLTADDVINLKTMLDAGGRLFLTGQDIAENLAGTADSSFLFDYLHVRFKPGNPLIMVQGVPGDPIGDGHLVAISGSGGAANQNSPDILLPDPCYTKPVYTYYSSSDVAAVRVGDGGYRVVFFGFGFEGVANNLGYNTREDIWPRVFDWLIVGDELYRPGDLDCSGSVNPIDAVYMVNLVYRSLLPPCSLNAADVNADCAINLIDVVYMVNLIYKNLGELQPGCFE